MFQFPKCIFGGSEPHIQLQGKQSIRLSKECKNRAVAKPTKNETGRSKQPMLLS